jgi:fimbrial chaperone protein
MTCVASARNRARRLAHPGFVALVAMLAMATMASPALASTVSIDRTRVYLSRARASELITLTNDSDEPIRLQVTAHRWTQAPGEPIRLEPTEDVIFFPALMTIEAKQSRAIRVGLSRAPDDQERAYRLIIEELPPPPRAGGAQLTVLTRLSVPVFVQPAKAEPKLAVTALAATADGMTVTIVNHGSMHVMVENVAIQGRDRESHPTGSAEAAGWYVLAGSTQTFQLTMSSPCPGASAFEVTLKSGETVSRHALPGSSICQP